LLILVLLLCVLGRLRSMTCEVLGALLDRRSDRLLGVHLCDLLMRGMDIALHRVRVGCVSAERHVVDAVHALVSRGDRERGSEVIAPRVGFASVLGIESVHGMLRLSEQRVVRM
jgi:hypothetical protein